MHLDISGINIDLPTILQVATRGLRKSRTLQSVHMCNMNVRSAAERLQLRQAMKADDYKPASARLPLATVDLALVQSLIPKRELEGKAQLDLFQHRRREQPRNALADVTKKPLFEVENQARLCFERNLGHLEMIMAHKWREVLDTDCSVCRKKTYCLFPWNKRLSMTPSVH